MERADPGPADDIPEGFDSPALRELLAAKPELLVVAATHMSELAERMQGYAEEFRNEVVAPMDSCDPQELAVAAGHAASLREKFLGEIDHLGAVNATVQEAAPGSEVGEAMAEFCRAQQAQLRHFADQAQAACEYLLLRPSEGGPA